MAPKEPYPPITLSTFNLLSQAVESAYMLEKGTCLAQRREEEYTVQLYHLPGAVFAELSYDLHADRITGVRAFADADELEGYTLSITLTVDL